MCAENPIKSYHHHYWSLWCDCVWWYPTFSLYITFVFVLNPPTESCLHIRVHIYCVWVTVHVFFKEINHCIFICVQLDTAYGYKKDPPDVLKQVELIVLNYLRCHSTEFSAQWKIRNIFFHCFSCFCTDILFLKQSQSQVCGV
jgi:hypothetical protein